MGPTGNMAAVNKNRKTRRLQRQISKDSDTDDEIFLPSGHTNILADLPSPTFDTIVSEWPQIDGVSADKSVAALARKSETIRSASTGSAGSPKEGPRLENVQPLSNYRPFYGRNSQRNSRSRHDSASRDSISSDIIRSRSSSIVDNLLCEIYDRWHYPRSCSFDDSDTTFTEYSSTSDAFFSRSDSIQLTLEEKHSDQFTKKYLETKDISELRRLRSELQHRSAQNSARLIRQLKNRDRRLAKFNKNCDLITAILQASSQKRRIDSKIKFSIEPLPGEDAFNQWRDAMKAVARLPLGIPAEFRKKVWLALADNHITNLKVDWDQTRKLAFNERSNPDDNKLGLQIVKDLHRTGCSGFSGTDNEEDRAVLKRVLLAFARWNKKVGYCQGFNVLAALILDVMNRKEDDALKVMIYLVDHVLPESYFANNLRALSVDMAVFRDLLHLQLPELSKHLDHLQLAARDDTTGANYEPPLTNVFTMQWFLTLFATCLPKASALRVWDCALLEGSEILLRTAVAIWGQLQSRIMNVGSADEFYSTMGTLTNEMLNCSIIETDDLIKKVYSMAPMPNPQLNELREKYTYNITPFSAAMSTGPRPHAAGRSIFSDDDDFDEDEFVDNINCFGGMFPPQASPSRKGLGDLDKSQSGSSYDISKVSPGAYGAQPEIIGPLASAYAERMSLDIDQLKKQYKRLKVRQNQAHIIIAAATAKQNSNHKGVVPTKTVQKTKPAVVATIQSPVAVNHLFIGRNMLVSGRRNKAVTQAPNIAPFYPKSNLVSTQIRPKSDNDGIESIRQQYRKTKNSMSSDDFHCSDENKKSPSRTRSVDSSGSGNSTLQSSQMSDSTSDASTFGMDSELGQSDLESHPGTEDSSSECAEDLPDLIDLKDGEKTKEISEDQLDSVQDTPAADSDHHETDVSTSDEADIGNGESLPEPSDDENHRPDENGSNGANVDERVSESQKQTGDLTLNFESNKNISQGPKFKTVMGSKHRTSGSSPNGNVTLLQLSRTSSEGEDSDHSSRDERICKCSDPSGEIFTDPETHYVASLTYKAHHKSISPLNSTNSNSSHHHHHYHHYQHHDSSLSVVNPSTAFDPTPMRAPKVFNPFPGQHMNSRKMQNGVKLGLYSANNMPKLETGISKPAGPKHIGRSQINACLHRQYMAEIKQQAKGAKR